MRPEPNLEELNKQARENVRRRIKRIQKKARKAGMKPKDTTATKIPASVRLERSRGKSKAAKKARRANRD